MTTITSVYLGELRTEATHVKSGKVIWTDAPTDNNGKGEAFSPTDLVCTALTSCMMTIMGITAKSEGFSLEGLTAKTTKLMAASPRKIEAIEVDFHWTQPPISGEKLAKLKEAALSCPVALSLSESIQQKIQFHF